jgi:hypothetical protein
MSATRSEPNGSCKLSSAPVGYPLFAVGLLGGDLGLKRPHKRNGARRRGLGVLVNKVAQMAETGDAFLTALLPGLADNLVVWFKKSRHPSPFPWPFRGRTPPAPSH